MRLGTPPSLHDAPRLGSGYLDHYSKVRLNTATSYLTPKGMLAGGQRGIHAERGPELETAQVTADGPGTGTAACFPPWKQQTLP